MKAWLLFLVLAVLLVLGSVIEVRVLVLPFSVPVPSWFHSLTPAPQFLVWCCVERRGAPGCWELGAVRMGWVGLGTDRLLLRSSTNARVFALL